MTKEVVTRDRGDPEKASIETATWAVFLPRVVQKRTERLLASSRR